MSEFNARGYEMNGPSGSGAMWFVAGALVGAAAALIFAPAKGRDTREYLGRRGRELADDVTDRSRKLADEAAARGRQLWNEHGDRVTAAVKKGYEHAAGAVAETVRDAVDTGKAM